jgi:hypothetical protein
MSIKKNTSLKEPLALNEKNIESTKINDGKEFNNVWPPKKESRPREKINFHNHYRKPK